MASDTGGLAASGTQTRPAVSVEPSHDAIVGLDGNGMIRSWSPAATDLYGYSPVEVLNRNWEVIIPPELRRDEAAILRCIMAGEEVERHRTRRVRQDGAVITVLSTISPFVDQDGTVIGAINATRWFSELDEARDRFEIRMECLRDEAAYASDQFDVHVDETREQADQARERFEAGVDRERATNQDAADRVRARVRTPGAPPSSYRVDAELQQAHDSFEARVDEQRTDAHNAEERFETYVHESLDQARRAQERFEGLVDRERRQAEDAANRFQARVDGEQDSTRRVKHDLEARLHQSQRLEVLGQLAGGVAHDFNNLLAVILNYASFVAEELATVPPPTSLAEAGRDVGQIQRAAERAATLTHQLLAFARREVIKPRVLDLNDVVTDITHLLDRTISEDVVLHTDLEAGLWSVLADAGQIEQVLVNLAVNARDAMKGGGTLSIDTANVRIDAEPIPDGSLLQQGRYVRLRVGDTGTGMTADVIERVFEPFYTTKRDGAGTGLGLATVHGIVTKAGGVITIDSQPGFGTTFTIMLPVTDEIAEPVAQAPRFDHISTGQTVLVVEDEPALREVLERIFTRHGYHVVTAADGAEALALAADHDGDIHLLVTDVVMPKMRGNEVADAVRRIRPELRVLYISGYARPVLAAKGTLDRDVHLIEKPFTASAIIEKAAHLLS
ncbi:ATP-binding protein [Actinoplanes sp. GCM10030250]|uniref:ATP-binding protein n=1 Tax=Actinoplanes sp. GCM10030250 TaxID=3273376 RepID=UPI00360BF613